MYRCWDHLLLPLCRSIGATAVCEIGAQTGRLTERIIRYCESVGGIAYAIDPAPRFPVTEWTKRHGERFVFYEDRSLNALPRIADLDLVLIDGDHNWYTVIHELRIIERRSAEDGRIPPVVALHDVGWPYGRRDLYYEPDTIPGGHRQPFAQLGLVPGSGRLVDSGFNAHLFNAINEHTIHNGVLTAVEDFVHESERDWRLVVLQGLHGIGILVDERRVASSAELGHFLDDLQAPRPVRAHLASVEEARIAAEIRILAQARDISAVQTALTSMEEANTRLEAELSRERARVVALRAELRRAKDQRQAERRLDQSLLDLSARSLMQADQDCAALRADIANLRQERMHLRLAMSDRRRPVATADVSQPYIERTHP